MKLIIYPVIAAVLFFASAATASPASGNIDTNIVERRSSDPIQLGSWHGVTKADVPASREG